MNRSFHKSQTLRFYDCSAVEVKSKFGAEFRRFSLDRHKPGKFEDFYKLVVHTHHISNTDVTIGYADVHGDLLPINNDDNFCKAVSSANPLLRVFIQKRASALLWRACTGQSSLGVTRRVTATAHGGERGPEHTLGAVATVFGAGGGVLQAPNPTVPRLPWPSKVVVFAHK
ncbi:PREDICTED: partitioning defective 6 homolog gamma-like, partial [Odobenus rosmarus divergens]|uniref:Partitioning defective 6 homolog gamma-like n=1 Tax=Odobenus rosmarus divergens TaxID=9708 RepID=A0A9B0M4G7_ODORO